MPENSHSLVDLAEKLFSIVENNKAELAIADVFYGDQTSILQTPTACIEPVRKRKELQGARRYVEVTLQVAVILYHAKVQDSQQTRREADRFAEAIEAKIDGFNDGVHASGTLGGLLVHGYVTSNESGYVWRKGEQYRSAVVTFEGTVKQILP